MIVNSLTDLNMHDSEILELIVDRTDTKANKIIVALEYIEDYESMQVSRKKLIFHRCYRAVLDMNFGIIAPESISTGYEIENSELLNDLMSDSRKIGIDLTNSLTHFCIETNSTGGTINVVAERIEFLDGP